MVREYFEEFAFWFLLFFAFFIMIQSFRPLAKIVTAKLPVPMGAKETMAA